MQQRPKHEHQCSCKQKIKSTNKVLVEGVHFISLILIFHIHICNGGELHETILSLENKQQPQTSLINIQNIISTGHRCFAIAARADVQCARVWNIIIICVLALLCTWCWNKMGQFVLPLCWRGQGQQNLPSNRPVFQFTIFVVGMILLSASPDFSRTG